MSNIKLKATSGGSLSLGAKDTTGDNVVLIDPKMFPTAWVNFDGTSAIGTDCTVGDSMNINRVEHTGTGVYLIHFTTPMDVNTYSLGGMCGRTDSISELQISQYALLVGTFNVVTTDNASTAQNANIVTVNVLGGKTYV